MDQRRPDPAPPQLRLDEQAVELAIDERRESRHLPVALAFTFVFLVAVVWWGFPEVTDAFEFESRTESLAFPMAPFLVALMVGFIFMGISVFFQIYREFHKLRGRRAGTAPRQSSRAKPSAASR